MNDEAASKKDLKTRLSEFWKTLAAIPRLMRLVWDAQPFLFCVFFFVELLMGLVPLASVWVVKTLVDAVPQLVDFSPEASLARIPANVVWALILVACSWFVKEVSEPIADYCREQINENMTRNINLMTMDKVNSIIDIAILENPKFYDRLQRVQNDMTYRPIQILGLCAHIGRFAISLFSLSFLLAWLNPLLIVLIYAFSAPKIIQLLKHSYEFWDVITGDVPEVRRMRYYTQVLTNNLDGKEIRLFGLGSYFRSLFLDTFTTFHKRRQKVRLRHLIRNTLLATLAATGSILAYLYAAYSAILGRISAGDMAMYLGSIAQIESSLAEFSFIIIDFYKQALYMNEFFEFLEIKPVIEPLAAGTAQPVPASIKQGIEFRNVSFKYPDSDRYVLNGVSFKIEPQQTVALVGENGAGKTTIVKLLSRLYDPTEGEILIDGIELRRLDAEEWRSQMSVVFQDYCRFQMTAQENIGIGDVKDLGKIEKVKEAAERGGASPVVAKLSRGYDTMLGKSFEKETVGTELSGGEWQKIALSRAFMRSCERGNGDNGKGAQLLILDEPTAALDVQSEHDVYLRFSELTKEKMALLITHRFSTVRIADKILVLDEGKVIEEGTHDNLISSDTHYARLYNLQAERYK